MPGPPTFPTAPDAQALERGQVLAPRFDADGLIASVATDAATGEVLMFAWMNAEALKATLDTGVAHYWSRSRRTLWKKGETSGQLQTVVELRVDCDQDAVWMKVKVGGDGGACHVGFRSCFYRVVENGVLVERSRPPHSARRHRQREFTTMSSESLHVPREKLSPLTLHMHYAITSLIEELEAVDWYRQRADDTQDPELKAILLHNAAEEIEHAAMALEWIRRNDADFDKELKEYLFTEGSITGREEHATKQDAG